mgnify:CR=1 FL=1
MGSEMCIRDSSNIVRSVTEEPFQEEQGDVDLESADVLISVGRGIEKEENVPLAFELARKWVRRYPQVDQLLTLGG